MSSVEDRLLLVFQAAFPTIPPSELKTATAESLEAWDSLATVTLVSLVQEEYGVEIPPEETMTLMSFAGFRDVVERLMND